MFFSRWRTKTYEIVSDTAQPTKTYHSGASRGTNGFTAALTRSWMMYAARAFEPNVRKTPSRKVPMSQSENEEREHREREARAEERVRGAAGALAHREQVVGRRLEIHVSQRQRSGSDGDLEMPLVQV